MFFYGKITGSSEQTLLTHMLSTTVTPIRRSGSILAAPGELKTWPYAAYSSTDRNIYAHPAAKKYIKSLEKYNATIIL